MFGYFIIKKNIFYLIFQNLLTTIRNSLRNLILDYFKSIINKIYYFNLKSSCFTIFCLKNQHYFTNNHFILFIKIYFSEKNLNMYYSYEESYNFIGNDYIFLILCNYYFLLLYQINVLNYSILYYLNCYF